MGWGAGQPQGCSLTGWEGKAGLNLFWGDFGCFKNLRRNKLLAFLLHPLAGARLENEWNTTQRQALRGKTRLPSLPLGTCPATASSASGWYWVDRLRTPPFCPSCLELAFVTYTQKGPHHHITTPLSLCTGRQCPREALWPST